jgi:hypothetical protein
MNVSTTTSTSAHGTTDTGTTGRTPEDRTTRTAHVPLTRRALDAIAHRLSDRGPEGALAELVEVAVAARDAGLRNAGFRGAAIDLLVDPTAPAVVRERAFAVVARQLSL